MKEFKYKDYQMKVEFDEIWEQYEITITNNNTKIVYNLNNNIAKRGAGIINNKNIVSDNFASWKGSGVRLSDKEINELKNIDKALPYFIS